MAKKKPKLAGTKVGAAERQRLFIEAFLTNGRNATQAAIAAGFSARTAAAAGSRLLRRVKGEVAERTAVILAQAEERTGVKTEEVLARLALADRFDPRRLMNADGSMRPLHELEDDAAAGIDRVELEAMVEAVEAPVSDARRSSDKSSPEGADAKPPAVRRPVVQKLRVATISRTQVREQAMKHLGLFEMDNRQRAPRTVNIGTLTISLDFEKTHPRAPKLPWHK